MNRDRIVEAFRHHAPSTGSIELQQRIAETMTAAVVDVAGSLPDCDERSAFIDFCRRAQWMANAAAVRPQAAPPLEPAEPGDTPKDNLTGGPQLSVSDDGTRPTSPWPARSTAPPRSGPTSRPGSTRRQGSTGARSSASGCATAAGTGFPPATRTCSGSPATNTSTCSVSASPGGRAVHRRSSTAPTGASKHTSKQRVIERYLMQAGETYDVRFDFDAGGGRIVLALADSSGAEVMRATAKPNIAEIPFASGQKIAVGFGFSGEYENEPAQPGWVWSDLRIELAPVGR